MKIFIVTASVCLVAAGASAMSDAEMDEFAATIINLNDHLCAKVVSIKPLRLADSYEVTCTQYRGGSATKIYVMNAAKGTAVET